MMRSVQPIKPLAAAVVIFLAGSSGIVSAGDRIGLRPGMSPEEANAAMAGRCPDSYVGPPWITCINKGIILTATFTKKKRLNWLRLMEPSQEDAQTYAKKLAAEVGFTGTPEPCVVYEANTFCFKDAEGTVLGAGSTEYDGMRTSYFFNPRFEQEDGGIE